MCLSGEAAVHIESLKPTNENYDEDRFVGNLRQKTIHN